MKRVTKNDLQAIVDRINRIMKTPQKFYTRQPLPDGRTKTMVNVRHYDLHFTYGGVALYQTVNENGGIRDVLNTGHVPKRELQRLLFAYIYGMEDAV